MVELDGDLIPVSMVTKILALQTESQGKSPPPGNQSDSNTQQKTRIIYKSQPGGSPAKTSSSQGLSKEKVGEMDLNEAEKAFAKDPSDSYYDDGTSPVRMKPK